MNREEFIQICVNSGYANKVRAECYAADGNTFTEKDIETVYREHYAHKIGGSSSTDGTLRKSFAEIGNSGRITRPYFIDDIEESNR